MKLKDNKIFYWISVPICVLLCFLGRFIPINGLDNAAGSGALFIFIACLFLWLTIGIGWPSILCVVALGCLNYTTFGDVLKSSYGDPTFLFLLFTFVLTYALSKTSFIKRIVYAFVNNRVARKNGYLFIFLFLLSILLIGLFMAPTVLFAVALPILNEIMLIAKLTKKDKVAKVLMMGLGFVVSISCSMTPIAHVFIVMAWAAAKVSVASWSYIAVAMPVGFVTFGLMFLVFSLYLRKKDVAKLTNINVAPLKKALPKMDWREIVTLVIFLIVLLLWILPSILKDAAPKFYEIMNTRMGIAMPAMAGTVVLCAINVKGKPLVEITSALKEGIPWESLLMCAATLALGAAFQSEAVGLKQWLNNLFSGSLSHLPAIACLIIFGLWAALQTNVSSNMVTATLVAAVAASIIRGASIPLNLNATISIIGLLSGFAFATPPAMPHIALVAGSDYCDTKSVLAFGSATMGIGLLAALAMGYPLATLVM